MIIITGLQDTTLALDFRVTILENGGSDGNSSIAEPEVRVETLEGTAADHETRLTSTESSLLGKNISFQFLKYYLTYYIIAKCPANQN